jgi:hypothetical protein
MMPPGEVWGDLRVRVSEKTSSRQLVNRDVKKASSVVWSSLLEIPEGDYWEALTSVYGLHHK